MEYLFIFSFFFWCGCVLALVFVLLSCLGLCPITMHTHEHCCCDGMRRQGPVSQWPVSCDRVMQGPRLVCHRIGTVDACAATWRQFSRLFRKVKKTLDLRTIMLRMSWFCRNLQKVTPKESLLAPFWVTLIIKTALSCNKPSYWSHHAQDSRKNIVFIGPGAQTL